MQNRIRRNRIANVAPHLAVNRIAEAFLFGLWQILVVVRIGCQVREQVHKSHEGGNSQKRPQLIPHGPFPMWILCTHIPNIAELPILSSETVNLCQPIG